MKAVVMAGGEGSRLRPLTSNMPKPLVPVAGRPIMEHILLHLRRHQLRDVVATVQYLGASIRNYFGDGSEQGVALSYSVEDSPLGTAGSVMLARQQLNEPFVVISGDSLTDHDLGAAARFHRERKAIATIVLKPVPNPLEYGVVVVDEGGAVQRFIEKPSWGEVISDLANTGIYILDPAVFEFFRTGEVTDWSGDVFPKLLKEGEHVFGWIADGYWEDVGSHAAYVKANFDCLEGRVSVQLPGDRVGDSTWIHPEAEVFPGARVDGPALIGPGAKVRAVVRPLALGSNDRPRPQLKHVVVGHQRHRPLGAARPARPLFVPPQPHVGRARADAAGRSPLGRRPHLRRPWPRLRQAKRAQARG